MDKKETGIIIIIQAEIRLEDKIEEYIRIYRWIIKGFLISSFGLAWLGLFALRQPLIIYKHNLNMPFGIHSKKIKPLSSGFVPRKRASKKNKNKIYEERERERENKTCFDNANSE